MPHKCVTCGNVYPDGSDDILSGCSECDKRKFEYISVEDSKALQDREKTNEDSENTESEVLNDAIIIDDDTDENKTQEKARSELVSDEDLPQTESAPTSIGNSETDLSEVKEQLHDQFEGIRIIEPGQYQLNLMKLYEKKDCVISLQEDGRYIINVPGLMETDKPEHTDDN